MLERRATYLSLVHDHYVVDMLTEEDVAAGRLKEYDALYVVDPNISARAIAAIEQWVRDGGYVFGSCGAGSRDEFNEPGRVSRACSGSSLSSGARSTAPSIGSGVASTGSITSIGSGWTGLLYSVSHRHLVCWACK
jgi:hypothetical protein